MAGQRARAGKQGKDRDDHGRRHADHARGPRPARSGRRHLAVQSEGSAHARRTAGDPAGAVDHRREHLPDRGADRREPADLVRPDGKIRGSGPAVMATHLENASGAEPGARSFFRESWLIVAIELLLIVGGFVVLWPSAAALVAEWENTDNTTYTHGFLIAAICLWLLFRRHAELRSSPVGF